MCRLPDGSRLAPFTGLAVHICTATEDAYYAMLATDTSGNVVDTVVPGLNATTEPVAETAIATQYPKPVLHTASTARPDPTSSQFSINGVQNLSAVISLHQSSAGGGAPPNLPIYGDIWQFWGDSSQSYQEGVQQGWNVRQHKNVAPNYLLANWRDTLWRPDAVQDSSPENFHFGVAFRPIGSSAPAKLAPAHQRRLVAFVQHLISHYGANPNKIVLGGSSMGGMGGTNIFTQFPDLFSAVFFGMVRTRLYVSNPAGWMFIPSGVPFAAGTGSTPLGTDPNLVMMDDGVTTFREYCDNPVRVLARHDDMPFYIGSSARDDTDLNIPQGFLDWIELAQALETNRHGYGIYWNTGGHQPDGLVVFQSDYGGARPYAKYNHETFARNVSYPAISQSSINDDPNVHSFGGYNVGFEWTTPVETPTSWSCSIINNYMSRTPTSSIGPRNGTYSDGPQIGAQTTMTCLVTPRRRQTFLPPIGAAVNYSYTPAGGSPVTGSVVVENFGTNGRISVPIVINAPGFVPGFTSLTLSLP
jgi:pimeloyl-ACP methyl ester carboxylesterase